MNNKNRKSKKHRRNTNATKNSLHNKKLDMGLKTWVENYTSAVTGQLKHQVEYWKARALALENENKHLHIIIKENNFKSPSNYVSNYEDYYKSDNENTKERERDNQSNEDDECMLEANSDCSMEVSKEFLEFLVKNKDFKEQARIDKEQLRQQELETKENIDKTETVPTEESLRNLYGDNWERICAMETVLMCDWVTESEIHKPSYWPIIPFNLNDL